MLSYFEGKNLLFYIVSNIQTRICIFLTESNLPDGYSFVVDAMNKLNLEPFFFLCMRRRLLIYLKHLFSTSCNKNYNALM